LSVAPTKKSMDALVGQIVSAEMGGEQRSVELADVGDEIRTGRQLTDARAPGT
jgi:hypothetical protein